MDVDSSDFLVPNPRPRSSRSGGVLSFLRKGWGLLLPLVFFVPLGISLLSSHVPKEKSFRQDAQERSEKLAAQAASSRSQAETAPSGELSSASGDEASSGPSPDNSDTPAREVAEDGSLVAPSSAEPVPGAIRYLVQRGDTLSEIAERHGVKSADIVAASGMEGRDYIVVGQVLTIPSAPKPEEAPSKPDPAKPGKPQASKTAVAAKEGDGEKKVPASSSAARPERTVKLGPPAPDPFAAPQPTLSVSGFPAAPSHPTSGAPTKVPPTRPLPGSRPVKLGPRAYPDLPGATPPSPANRQGMPPSNTPVAVPPKQYPDKADYQPLSQALRPETVYAAALLPVSSQSANGFPPSSGATKSPTRGMLQGAVISYVVQPFDTPSSIAKAHGTTADVIFELNNISEITENQTILLPISQNKLANPAASR